MGWGVIETDAGLMTITCNARGLTAIIYCIEMEALYQLEYAPSGKDRKALYLHVLVDILFRDPWSGTP